ncbi:MAG: aminoacyl-tRNA deacylase [Peptoniphilaceae bacterium]|uniref:aminoacyl-tRNA deacylase n=1 Tax=Parvimonas sp. TaxID=1944660 RepID=UPI002A7542D1|nr:aminoacyl-tRNA deacylase [Parvimonas sp.]MDD7765526.1 aminoacyl-tRNA deacylase [Peptoniphilaceae bacterium]MDY3051067.1 aminoacyl-tRNA deacylase [Parvimonas sp.]
MKKINKTNVCRILDREKVNYELFIRTENESFEDIGLDSDIVFKTLVLVGSDKNNYVCIIPLNEHLSLKKAAKNFEIKNIEMLLQKELKNLTGYIHGGCSPLGMKVKFRTLIDERAKNFDHIVVSAGKLLHFVKLNPVDLAKLCDAKFCNLVV